MESKKDYLRRLELGETEEDRVVPIPDLRPRPLEYNDTFMVNGFIYRCVDVKSRDRFTIKCLGEANAEGLAQ